MEKKLVLVPTTESESEGGYQSHDGRSLAYVKEELLYVGTQNDLTHFLKWFLINHKGEKQYNADLIARNYVADFTKGQSN